MSRTGWVLGMGLGVALASGAVWAQKAPAPPAKPGAAAPQAPGAAAPKASGAPAARLPDVPANEAAELRRLRGLLGPGAGLAYASAAVEGSRTRLTGFELHSGGQVLRAVEAVFEGVREDGFDRMTARGVVAAGGGAETVEMAGFARPAGSSAAALRLDSLSATGLRADLGRPATLERLSLRDVGAGREAVLEAVGVLVELGAGMAVEQVALRRLDATASDLPGLIAALGEMVPGRPATPMPGRQTVTGTALDFRAGGHRLGGVERIRLTGAAVPDGPTAGTLALEGIEVAEGTPLRQWLEPHGYAGLRGDLTVDTTQDDARGRLEIGALALAVREVGAIGLALTLEGLRNRPVMENAEHLALVSARLRYADQSLFGRVVETQARERRIAPAALRQEMAAQATATLSGPALAPLREPVLRFIQGEAREIELSLRPPQPLRLQALAALPRDPAGWQRALGASVAAR